MAGPTLFWIAPGDPPDRFPDSRHALTEPNGLLAAGGDLASDRLLYAYRHGIFPWFDDGQPILWWSPDPRCVLYPDTFRMSRRLRRGLRKQSFEVSYNTCFADVVAECAKPRTGQDGTWITAGMAAAYSELHRLRWAHSVEVWLEDRLVGGLYGLAIGRAFFGESMFSRVNDASKAAMYALCQQLNDSGFELLDCQVPSPHLLTLGATLLPRNEFQRTLETACSPPAAFDRWPGGRAPLGLSET